MGNEKSPAQAGEGIMHIKDNSIALALGAPAKLALVSPAPPRNQARNRQPGGLSSPTLAPHVSHLLRLVY